MRPSAVVSAQACEETLGLITKILRTTSSRASQALVIATVSGKTTFALARHSMQSFLSFGRISRPKKTRNHTPTPAFVGLTVTPVPFSGVFQLLLQVITGRFRRENIVFVVKTAFTTLPTIWRCFRPPLIMKGVT